LCDERLCCDIPHVEDQTVKLEVAASIWPSETKAE